MRKIDLKSLLKDNKTFLETRSDRQSQMWGGGSVEPASFEEIFGDLSNCSFTGNLDLSSLELNSLKGVPKIIKSGHFSISGNPDLENLDFFPIQLAFSKSLYIDYEMLPLFNSVDINTYKDCMIIISVQEFGLSDLEKNRDICVAFSDYRKVNGSFENVLIEHPAIDYQGLESLYSVYKKLDFNLEKFDRAIELL